MRKIVVLLVTVLTVLGLTACGKAKTVDVTDAASRLASEITYTDEMAEIDLDTAGMIYYLEDAQITNAKIYESSGATAEEIAVFECASSADADKVMTAMQQRVEEQKESFKDYVPEELLKLDNAVLIKNGNYVMLSVSDDAEAAQKIINSYF